MVDVIVVGGGAAGMMAAATCAERGQRTLLLERGPYTGRKLRITGKGRCNVTNDCSVRDAVAAFPTGGRFLTSALYAFTPQNTMAYFESLGVPLKVERGNRVFPVSDKAADIVEALRRCMKERGVTVRQGRATAVTVADGRVTGVETEDRLYDSGAVILATGGVSYPLTGSTGDGYDMTRALGHTVIAPKPSLVPLESSDADCREMQGLALKNVRLTVTKGEKKPVYSEQGELLFTHFGVSGPLVLSASAHMRELGRERYRFSIDLKPALDENKLDSRILRDFEKFSNRDFGNSLSELLNRLMIPVVVRRSGIPADWKVHSVTREQRKQLIRVIKDFTVEITGFRPIEEAIVTSGGVSTKEIDPRTMDSRLVRGLYFAGELIDADAYTGGFNLQMAWSTGRMAGLHAQRGD